MNPIGKMQAEAENLDRVKNTIAEFQRKHGKNYDSLDMFELARELGKDYGKSVLKSALALGKHERITRQNAASIPTWFLKITPEILKILVDSFSMVWPEVFNSTAVPSNSTEQPQEIQDSLFFFELSQRSIPEVEKSLWEIAVTLGKQEREMIRAAPKIPAWFYRLKSEQLAIVQSFASVLEQTGKFKNSPLSLDVAAKNGPATRKRSL